MKIAIAGTGYVGLSNAILLAQHHDVYAVDLIEEKVALINQGKSPLVDKEIEEYLARVPLRLNGDDRRTACISRCGLCDHFYADQL